MSIKTWSFLIVAGGMGNRLGGTPKQFRFLNAIPVWKWSAKIAEKLWEEGTISELVLVVPKDYMSKVKEQCDFKVPIQIIAGGSTRSQSVMNGLEISSGSHVLVHDAARPFITEQLCRDLITNASINGSAIPLLRLKDSLKRLDSGELTCVDRNEFFITQTPQAFEKAPLAQAITAYGFEGTDEATAWEAAGRELFYTEGLESNFKITTKFDWEAALSLSGCTKKQRTGHGFDIHQLVPDRKLILAGIELEKSELGLLGHSDADIVLHTVMDAILGAAGLPDIGTLFPASDENWKDADSVELLKTIVKLVRLEGWSIDWVDVTLQAQRPKLGHMIPIFIANVTSLISENEEEINFNMKVKSAEGCGSVGRNECMVCYGVATLSKYDWK